MEGLQVDYESQIGRGACGSVFLTNDPAIVAKVVDLEDDFEETNLDIPINKETKINEILNSSETGHLCPYVAKYYGNKIIKTKTGFKKMVIFMEYCKGGDLKNYVRKYGENGLTKNQLQIIIPQIITALLFIHSKGIVYSDVKPENFLLTSKEEYPMLKACDFGISGILRSSNSQSKSCSTKRVSTKTGTKFFTCIGGSDPYRAPEQKEMEHCSSKIDLWALGVLLYELITGSPFITYLDNGVEKPLTIAEYYKIKHTNSPPFPEGIDSDLKNLILRLLVKDENQRASWNELLNNKLVSKMLGEDKEVLQQYGVDVISERDLMDTANIIEIENEGRESLNSVVNMINQVNDLKKSIEKTKDLNQFDLLISQIKEFLFNAPVQIQRALKSKQEVKTSVAEESYTNVLKASEMLKKCSQERMKEIVEVVRDFIGQKVKEMKVCLPYILNGEKDSMDLEYGKAISIYDYSSQQLKNIIFSFKSLVELGLNDLQLERLNEIMVYLDDTKKEIDLVVDKKKLNEENIEKIKRNNEENKKKIVELQREQARREKEERIRKENQEKEERKRKEEERKRKEEERKRKEEEERKRKEEEERKRQFNPGTHWLLNGQLHTSCFGEKPGKTFNNYPVHIVKVIAGRSYPILLGDRNSEELGWVTQSMLTPN